MKEQKNLLNDGKPESGEWKTNKGNRVELLLYDRIDRIHEQVYETTTELDGEAYLERFKNMVLTNAFSLTRPLIRNDRLRVGNNCYEYTGLDWKEVDCE
jgi:hypothetical protein